MKKIVTNYPSDPDLFNTYACLLQFCTGTKEGGSRDQELAKYLSLQDNIGLVAFWYRQEPHTLQRVDWKLVNKRAVPVSVFAAFSVLTTVLSKCIGMAV